MAMFVFCLGILSVSSSLKTSKEQISKDDKVRVPEARGYFVRFRSTPVAGYKGDLEGFPATKSVDGGKIKMENPAVFKYSEHLKTRQGAVLESVGAKPIQSYSVVANAAFADLTVDQVRELRRHPEVQAVTKNRLIPATTFSTPNFLGLEQVWNSNNGNGPKGEDVVIGMIDSGIWPEHPSFAPLENAGTIESFNPVSCQTDNDSEEIACNTKILTCRRFSAGYASDSDLEAYGEVRSCRDIVGHGTHTASTAAGNQNVPVELATESGTTTVTISGMAPRARLAIYKVCMFDPSSGGCSGTYVDIITAIEQATLDGVDILSFSLGSSTTESIDDIDLAFYFATVSGVFVSAAAGNDGPAASSVSNIAPWITTVGASTHSRSFDQPFTFDNVAPDVAAFSSRGPALFADGILKPDIIAPGVQIFAAVSNGEYAFLDGTSMATPHISGLAAVIREAHPEWSPMQVKSAIMLTASQSRTDGSPIGGSPHGFGAGHVNIQRAVKSPLISIVPTVEEGLQYICYYRGGEDICFDSKKDDYNPADTNLPSLVLNKDHDVSRRIQNAGVDRIYVRVSASIPDADCSVSATPDEMEIAAGEYSTITVQTTCHKLETGFVTLSVSVIDHPITEKQQQLSDPEIYHLPMFAVFVTEHPEWIGDGKCDPSENNHYTGYDGGDCCPSTCVSTEEHSCGENGYDCENPASCIVEWLGDGWCDPENNNFECQYDHGDCCEESCVSAYYQCGENGFDCIDPEFAVCENASTTGDGICNPENNNIVCAFDGGDCCQTTCESSDCGSNGFDCVDPSVCIVNWISDGWCDPENNIPDCGFDGGDCCEMSCHSSEEYECGIHGYDCQDPDYNCEVPEFVGDGFCDPENNKPGCFFDGGDCCQSTCVSATYECGVAGYNCQDPDVCHVEWIGDGYCDSENNKLDCSYDGGDCCEESCVPAAFDCGFNGYDCINPEYVCERPEWAGDGYCDSENNFAGCNYDGGDCCESTCVPNQYECGSNDFDCKNPEICNAKWISDGYCDDVNNRLDCRYDGGDCCEATCQSTEEYSCGIVGYRCLDPEAPQCRDHDDYLLGYGKPMGIRLTCDLLGSLGFCHDNRIGHYLRYICPQTCGTYDLNRQIRAIAQELQLPIESCRDLTKYITCDDSNYGMFVRHFCPCSCNYLHFV